MPITEIVVTCNGQREEVASIDAARDLAWAMAQEEGVEANVWWNAVLWETYEP